MSGAGAAVVFRVGRGAVVLVSPHPELTTGAECVEDVLPNLATAALKWIGENDAAMPPAAPACSTVSFEKSEELPDSSHSVSPEAAATSMKVVKKKKRVKRKQQQQDKESVTQGDHKVEPAGVHAADQTEMPIQPTAASETSVLPLPGSDVESSKNCAPAVSSTAGQEADRKRKRSSSAARVVSKGGSNPQEQKLMEKLVAMSSIDALSDEEAEAVSKASSPQELEQELCNVLKRRGGCFHLDTTSIAYSSLANAFGNGCKRMQLDRFAKWIKNLQSIQYSKDKLTLVEPDAKRQRVSLHAKPPIEDVTGQLSLLTSLAPDLV
jgi:hypothetical protein